MENLINDIAKISNEMTERQKNFDAVMERSRDLVRTAGLLITKLHNDDLKEATLLLKKAKGLSDELKKSDMKFEYHTKQAQQEYAEAVIFTSIKTKRKIPSISDVGVSPDSYIMGLMDVVGELKRELVSSLSKGDQKYAQYCHNKMLEIFDSTRSVRFAEAILPGFRKKQDVARIQIESSASDLLHFGNKK